MNCTGTKQELVEICSAAQKL